MALMLDNALNIINGEVSLIIAAIKKNTKWSMLQHQDDINNQTLREFFKLKDIIKDSQNIYDIDQASYLTPFLNTIICEDTTGPVTKIALTSLQKFLQYNLLDFNHKNFCIILDKIAHSLIHARFIGTDPSNDEVVLQKILQVMQTLFMSPIGKYLNDQSVCGILHSFFRIAFETRLAELLRHFAENTLTDIFFTILDHVKLHTEQSHMQHLQSIQNNLDQTEINCINVIANIPVGSDSAFEEEFCAQTISNPLITDQSKGDNDTENSIQLQQSKDGLTNEKDVSPADNKLSGDISELSPYGYATLNELMRFIINLTTPPPIIEKQNQTSVDIKITYSLTLLTSAFETKGDDLIKHPFILKLVKDKLCRNLIEHLKSDKITILSLTLRLAFFLFKTARSHLKYQMEMFFNKLIETISYEGVLYQKKEYIIDIIVQFFKIPDFASELYLNYDCDLYGPDVLEDCIKILSKNAFPITGIYSIHILSLEALFAIIDDISQRCNKAVVISDDKSTLATTNTNHCSSSNDSLALPPSYSNNSIENQDSTQYSLRFIKNEKKILLMGTEKFNAKPAKGILFLKENGFFQQPSPREDRASNQLSPDESVNHSIALFLRENPNLDKKMVGEYLSTRKNIDILKAFVSSFNFYGTRIDEALRMYLESFRLPGEAPLISLLLENFAHHWHVSNGEPFVNEDAAFALAYAIIMLNVDQHHQIVKKQMNPMSLEEFIKNLTKVNGGGNFDRDMLIEIYNAIKSEEIIMPAEQTGLVKENYLWKVLLRRSESEVYHYFSHESQMNGREENLNYKPIDGIMFDTKVNNFKTSSSCDALIFEILWGPVLAASSYIYDKIPGIIGSSVSYPAAYTVPPSTAENMAQTASHKDERIINKIMNGFKKSALISNHFELTDVIDKLIITLCKFTGITNSNEPLENVAVLLGNSFKSMTALKSCFIFVRYHGDNLNEGWRYFINLLFTLLRTGLLPSSFMELDDFLSLSGRIPLMRSLRERYYYPDTRTQINYRTRFYYPHRYFHISRPINYPSMWTSGNQGGNGNSIFQSSTNLSTNSNLSSPNWGHNKLSQIQGINPDAYYLNSSSLHFLDYNPYASNSRKPNSGGSSGLLTSFYNYFASSTGLMGSSQPNSLNSFTEYPAHNFKLKTYKNGYPYYYYNPANPNSIKKTSLPATHHQQHHKILNNEGKHYLTTDEETLSGASPNRHESYRAAEKNRRLNKDKINAISQTSLTNPDYVYLLFGHVKEYSEADKLAIENARVCVENECQPANLIFDSKFLKIESLRELLKTLMYRRSECYNSLPQPNEQNDNKVTLDSPVSAKNAIENLSYPSPIQDTSLDISEDQLVFNLELLIKIVIQNRDRIQLIWPSIRSYFYEIIVNKGNSFRTETPPFFGNILPSNTDSSQTLASSEDGILESQQAPVSFNPENIVKPGKFTTYPGNNNISKNFSRNKRPNSLMNNKKRNGNYASDLDPNYCDAVAIPMEFLLERAVAGLFHMATRLLKKSDMVIRIIGSLRILLIFSDDSRDGGIAFSKTPTNTERSARKMELDKTLPHQDQYFRSSLRKNEISDKKSFKSFSKHLATAGIAGGSVNNSFANNYFSTKLSPHCAIGMAELFKLNINNLYECQIGQMGWAVLFACLERIGCSIEARSKTVHTIDNLIFPSSSTENFGDIPCDSKDDDPASLTNNMSSATSDTILYRQPTRSESEFDVIQPITGLDQGNRQSQIGNMSLNKSLEEWYFVANAKHTDNHLMMPSPNRSSFSNDIPKEHENISAPNYKSDAEGVSYDKFANSHRPVFEISIKEHNPFSFVKCCHTLAYLINFDPSPTIHQNKSPLFHPLVPNNFFLAQTTLLAFVEVYVKGKRTPSKIDSETGPSKRCQPDTPVHNKVTSTTLNLQTVTEFLFTSPRSDPSYLNVDVVGRTADANNQDFQDIVAYYQSVEKNDRIASSGYPHQMSQFDYQPSTACSEVESADSYRSYCPTTSADEDGEEAEEEDNITRNSSASATTPNQSDWESSGEETYMSPPPKKESGLDQTLNISNGPLGSRDSKKSQRKKIPCLDKYNDAFLLLLEMIFTMRDNSIDVFYSEMTPSADTLTLNSNGPVIEVGNKGTWIKSFLWPQVWKPLLGGICTLCLDRRRHVRLTSLTYLQRALLVIDFQEYLDQKEWVQLFEEILFPLIDKTLANDFKSKHSHKVTAASSPTVPAKSVANQPATPKSSDSSKHSSMITARPSARLFLEEETKHRLFTLMCKVFLQKLAVLFHIPARNSNLKNANITYATSYVALSTEKEAHDDVFARVWLKILNYMEIFLRSISAQSAQSTHNSSDMLVEAIPESLKNMLLVMDTSGLFNLDFKLRELTWKKINTFLPKILFEIRLQQEHMVIGSSSQTDPLQRSSPSFPSDYVKDSNLKNSLPGMSLHSNHVPPYELPSGTCPNSILENHGPSIEPLANHDKSAPKNPLSNII